MNDSIKIKDSIFKKIKDAFTTEKKKDPEKTVYITEAIVSHFENNDVENYLEDFSVSLSEDLKDNNLMTLTISGKTYNDILDHYYIKESGNLIYVDGYIDITINLSKAKVHDVYLWMNLYYMKNGKIVEKPSDVTETLTGEDDRRVYKFAFNLIVNWITYMQFSLKIISTAMKKRRKINEW